jgi:hypothetical protein
LIPAYYLGCQYRILKNLLKNGVNGSLTENVTSSSYGEGLETDQRQLKIPRQSFTRQELYKISKKIIEIEDFHSKTDRGIKQELYAHVLLINISRIFESTSLDNSKLLPNENNAELVNGEVG